jgi:hypothetical protein
MPDLGRGDGPRVAVLVRINAYWQCAHNGEITGGGPADRTIVGKVGYVA